MKYLEKSFSVYPLVKRKPVKKEGRTTYHFCAECKKVHEVDDRHEPFSEIYFPTPLSDKLKAC